MSAMKMARNGWNGERSLILLFICWCVVICTFLSYALSIWLKDHYSWVSQSYVQWWKASTRQTRTWEDDRGLWLRSLGKPWQCNASSEAYIWKASQWWTLTWTWQDFIALLKEKRWCSLISMWFWVHSCFAFTVAVPHVFDLSCCISTAVQLRELTDEQPWVCIYTYINI